MDTRLQLTAAWFVAVAIGLALIVATASLGQTAEHPPLAVAHRGTTEDCRFTENTVRSFRRCATDADMIETDMRLSSNRRPVFIHDATLDRTTHASGRVDARTFGALRKITTADGVGRIPSTKTLANHIAKTGQRVAIDVKVWPTTKGWRILREQLGPYRHKVLLFSARNDRYVKRAAEFGFAAAHFSWSDREPAPTVAQVREVGSYVWRGDLTDGQAATYRAAGIRMIQSGNTHADWQRAAAQGAWALNTDRVDDYLAVR